MKPATGYMVYLLIDPRDRVPFYAGMTCRPYARWAQHHSDQSSRAYERVRELRRLKIKCRVRIVAMNLERKEAQLREAALIALHGKTLANQFCLGEKKAFA